MDAGYRFHRSGTNYEFFTSFGAAYRVTFVPAGVYFENELLEDWLYRVDIIQNDAGPYNYLDVAVGITVADILLDFLEADSRRIVFYICDPTDGRGKGRERKFDYWYRLFQDYKSVRIVSTVKARSIEITVVFIYDQTNVLANDIPIIIEQAKDRFNNK